MRFVLLCRLFLLALVSSTIIFSCSDKKEEFTAEPLTDYIPLTVGKFVVYRIDSLVTTLFQKGQEIHSYQVKHVVDAEYTDNLGRPSFRIYRYLRNEDGTSNWEPSGSYFITPLADQIEVVEDNLRFIKLHAPLNEGFSWKGNAYLPTNPYDPFGYNFSNDDDIRDWDFNYAYFEPSLTVNGQTYNEVVTVEQEDDLSNVPIADSQSYGYRTRSVEKYAKGVGLVYREYELWEYQPNLSGPDPYYTGFGITMWMIDHN